MIQPTTPKTPNSSNRQSSFFDAFKSRIRRNKRRSRQSWGSQTINQCIRQSVNSYQTQESDTRSSSYNIIKDHELADLEARYIRYLASESSVSGLVEHLIQYQRAWKDILSTSLALHTDLLFFNDRSSTHRCHAEQLLNIMQTTHQTVNQRPMQRLITIINACKNMRDEFMITKKRYDVYTVKRMELDVYRKKVDELRLRHQANVARLSRKEAKLRALTSAFALLFRQLYHALEPFQPSLPSILNVPFCELFDTANAFHAVFAEQHRSATHSIVKQLDETPQGEERDLCLMLDFDVINEDEGEDDVIVEANVANIVKPAVRIMYRNPPYDETIPFVDYHRAFDPQRAFSFDAPHSFNPPPFVATAHIKNFIVTRSVSHSSHADGYHTHSHLYSEKKVNHVRSVSVSASGNIGSMTSISASSKSPVPPPLPSSSTLSTTLSNTASRSHHPTLPRDAAHPPAPPPPVVSPTMTSRYIGSQPSSPISIQSDQVTSFESPTSSPPPLPTRKAPTFPDQPACHTHARPPPLPNAAPTGILISAPVIPLNRASCLDMVSKSSISSSPCYMDYSGASKSSVQSKTPPRKFALSQLVIDTSKSRGDTNASSTPAVDDTISSSSIQRADSPRSCRAQKSPATSPGTVFIHRLQRSPSLLQQSRHVTSSSVHIPSAAAVFTVQEHRPDTPPRSRLQRTPSSSPLAARLAVFESPMSDLVIDISPRRTTNRLQFRDV